MARKRRSMTISGYFENEDEVLEQLGAGEGLERLNLTYCPFGDRGMDRLAGIGTLRDLNIGHTEVTARGLARLADLKGLLHLVLEGLPVGDADLVHLRPLTRLRSLNLSRTKITDDGVASLGGLIALQTIFLYDCPGLSAAAPSHLRHLPRLGLVGIDGGIATAAALAEIDRFPAIRQLVISGSPHVAATRGELRAALSRAHVADDLYPSSISAAW